MGAHTRAAFEWVLTQEHLGGCSHKRSIWAGAHTGASFALVHILDLIHSQCWFLHLISLKPRGRGTEKGGQPPDCSSPFIPEKSDKRLTPGTTEG